MTVHATLIQKLYTQEIMSTVSLKKF